MEFSNVTTEAFVATYQSSSTVFEGIIREVRELSKKKPDATMSAGKVKIVNRVLEDLIAFLENEPEGKYLEKLDDGALPQMSDAVLVMVQFETALKAFKNRYYKRVYGEMRWITKEYLADDNSDDDEEA